MSELPIVLVTGASGFIATHVVSILLAEKKYRVRGTVRDANNEKSTKPLKDAFPELELVSADLNKDDGWKEYENAQLDTISSVVSIGPSPDARTFTTSRRIPSRIQGIATN